MKLMLFINRCYAGSEKLWRVIVYGYLMMLIPMTAVTQIAKENLIKEKQSILAYIIILVSLIYYAWITFSIWKCSANTDKKIYKYLRRALSLITFIYAYSMAELLVSLNQFNSTAFHVVICRDIFLCC